MIEHELIIPPLSFVIKSNPRSIYRVGYKELDFLAAHGDDLHAPPHVYNPLFEFNLAGIWRETKNVNRFAKVLGEIFLHEYLHAELGLEKRYIKFHDSYPENEESAICYICTKLLGV